MLTDGESGCLRGLSAPAGAEPSGHHFVGRDVPPALICACFQSLLPALLISVSGGEHLSEGHSPFGFDFYLLQSCYSSFGTCHLLLQGERGDKGALSGCLPCRHRQR